MAHGVLQKKAMPSYFPCSQDPDIPVRVEAGVRVLEWPLTATVKLKA